MLFNEIQNTVTSVNLGWIVVMLLDEIQNTLTSVTSGLDRGYVV